MTPCYHCAEPVPAHWQQSLDFDGEPRLLCCPGCAAVMRTILDAGLADYYRYRSKPAPLGALPDAVQHSLDELSVYDTPEISARYCRPLVDPNRAGQATDDSTLQAGLVDINLAIEGLRCGACVWLLERSLRAVPGVTEAVFNFSTHRGRIRFDRDQLTLSRILLHISELGYRAIPFDARERELALKRESRQRVQQLFVAGIATMQVMMYALPAYITGQGDIDPAHEQLLRWASLVLTTPVMLYSAQPFLKGAVRDINRRQPGMDTPVSLALLAAFSASVWSTLTASGEIYFDSVAMFVFLLLGARYIEFIARRRAASTVDELSAAAPDTALQWCDEQWQRVPAIRLIPGNLIRVEEGARIPVDARVTAGSSMVDNALLTGESLPEPITVGDSVAGGALLVGAPLDLAVTRPQYNSALSMIDQLIDRGAAEKPRTVQMADRAAGWFVMVVLLLTALVWCVWQWMDPGRAAEVAITVLVVSCPCALSLAMPSALAATTGSLLRSRLLVTRSHAIESLAQVTDVVFDKTGTLTLGQPALTGIDHTGAISADHAVQLAAALDSGSTHPFARALVSAAAKLPASECSDSPHSDLSHEVGQGVSATLNDGSHWRVGRLHWCSPAEKWDAVTSHVECGSHGNRADFTASMPAVDDVSHVYLSRQLPGAEQPTLMARFHFRDVLRPEAVGVVQALQDQNLKVHLLSGDRRQAAQQIASTLHIESWQAEATPADKQVFVKALQRQSAHVLMIGDGINDAPVLALADVSLALGHASALAHTAADTLSLAPGLQGLMPLLAKARRCAGIVRQNLCWAALYNLSAIPLAASGAVPPWAAALGMAGSSLLVVANASRLWNR